MVEDHEEIRPCALICRGEQSLENTGSRLRQETSVEKTLPHDATDALQLDSEETIVVQLADKVDDGTKCYTDSMDVCIGGDCMKVGCDLRVGSNKNTDPCGVCGGNGSSCQSRYSWSLESISACSKSCGGGFKIAMAVCKAVGSDENVVDDSYCDPDNKPEKTLIPCNTHPCSAKWVAGEWSMCSASCGGGSRTRNIFCTEENGNETAKCSTTCGTGVRTRTIECRDAIGSISKDCDPAERPHTEQECKTNIPCPIYGEEMTQPLMQPYPPPPVSEKLIDQPIPSETTFIAKEWSSCSVTCGEGIRHREVRCKIYLEFSQTVADLPDRQCSGPKPLEKEKCIMPPCNIIENSLTYGIDTVGDSGYAEPSLTDTYRSSAGGSSGSGYDAGIKVAPGSDVQTTYSWKEGGYTPCSATCLGGSQELIVNCVRDDTGKTVMPFLCTADTKPEVRIRVCNDHPCPPRWNFSEFSPCMSPCGIGIQTRDVTCIHEVIRGTEKPCNTRACHEMDAGSLPIITSQNTTYNQTDLNAKVDLKIGGVAKVFQGTSSIKIRCPVRKFDKAQIAWTKDNKELRKSRKYKISRKGALKINDITSTDTGVYACIAGNSHAETHLIVKFRSKEQISSEEYLRLSNSVHRQRNANLDSAPANSGESLYTDRAAAYGNRFVPIDSEDLSHERAAPSKPTRKPHQKKQKTSPTPPDSTMIHKEHTVTSLNQEYWPFQSDSTAGRTHRTAPVTFIDDVRKDTAATKRTIPERNPGLRYQSVEDNLDTLYRNTAIPDETFGPDEERIFIDVDPYDLDESIFGLQHSDPVKITPVASKDDTVTPTRTDIDYIEESLKNVKRQWHDTSEVKSHWSSTPKNQNKESVNLATNSDNIGLEVYYISDSKHSTQKFEESRDKDTDSSENEHHVSPTMSFKETDTASKEPDTDNEKTETLNKTEDYGEIFEEEMKKRRIYVENDTVDDGRAATTRDLEDDLIDLALTEDRGSEEMEKSRKNLSRNREDRNNSSEETTDFQERPPSEEVQKTNKSLDNGTITAGSNATVDSTIASLSILDARSSVHSSCSETDWEHNSYTTSNSHRGNIMRRCWTSGASEGQTMWIWCFNWKTAMQRRDVTCRLVEDMENGQENITLLDPSKCDDTTRPLQRQECYNDACKGVWRVGEWSEVLNNIEYLLFV
ncbi:hypothetical protein E2986_06800 [Frieseomelitta varia]|uniref:Ig-like domain-containing protein n=1 Tax=Frieseomelitta varia TaxID=561572 RepID=A0A833RUR7_9HYME|nr:hypothetical protein E2986_06800 [Frieseomelitta varia]